MGELSIRRNRGFTVPRYQEVGKGEKASGAAKSQSVSKTGGAPLQETLGKLTASQADGQYRASRQTLRTGEAVLSEVQDKLSRMADLAREAAGGGKDTDRAALQEELEQLRGEVDRILTSAVAGETRLFLDEDTTSGMDLLLYALTGDPSANQGAAQALPSWLTSSLTMKDMSPEQLLTSLGLDKSASGAEVLAALADKSLDSSSAAGYLASLYLGAVIAGGGSAESIDPQAALEGLRQLLDKIAGGTSPDQAVAELSDGAFTSLADFENQFTEGIAPGLQAFLTDLLLSDSGALLVPIDSPLLGILANMEGMNLELLISLLGTTASQVPEASADTLPEAQAAELTATGAEAPSPASVLQAGTFQVTGQDLSGVSFDASAGTLTIGGSADVTVQSTEPGGQQTILLTGSGTVTLQGVNASQVTVASPEARILSAGESFLGALQLQEGTTLTLEGGGVLRIASLQGNQTNTLRITDGAVILSEKNGNTLGTLSVPVVVEGPAILAAQASTVQNANGKPLDAFDVLWKALLSGFNSLTSLELDGRQARMALLSGTHADFVRLWLEKGDPSSHGSPLHALTLRGRDKDGEPRTRYAYLHWNQNAGAFEEVSVFPNPFTVTGGEEHRDWVYEEDTRTLRILSSRVTAVSGGTGTDTAQAPFSGRIALADRIGQLELALGGVVCRVSAGRAFDLGRENDVSLLLQRGTSNIFHSGAGCAGISLGDGTSLRIDQAESHSGDRNPDGTLTASGGSGGAGIGRDSGGSGDRESSILIRGGVITATGTGGGAGIGAGRRGAMGEVTILGGTVTSTGGEGGGAGIGGALGARAGHISIRGGAVSAAATHHAAAIGAGVQGPCGDITIAGTARIVQALGGDPGADIGACLFGACGRVSVAEGVDLGGARLWTPPGLSSRMGAESIVPPQFRISARTLRLDRILLSTSEGAKAAKTVIDADRQWVSQIQAAYSTLYDKLEQSISQERTKGPVRDTAEASILLQDVRQSIPLPSSQALQTHSKQGGEDVRRLFQ